MLAGAERPACKSHGGPAVTVGSGNFDEELGRA
jgi:hypothetical protein